MSASCGVGGITAGGILLGGAGIGADGGQGLEISQFGRWSGLAHGWPWGPSEKNSKWQFKAPPLGS